mmetsp:Transcript_105176/g.181741  ORF Transcript_105176/g.181741 Transcript_105176/m.181741 type:complete len:748 (+) Transcript_105176:81-2324(+)
MQFTAFAFLVALLVCIITPQTTGLISGDTIFLKSHRGTGNHLEAEDRLVQARYKERGGWQSLIIEKEGGGAILAGDTVFLKTHLGTFIHVQDLDVRADWSEKGIWQSFTIQHPGGCPCGPDIHPGDDICLLAHTGHHIDVEGTSVRARYHFCGERQQFAVQQELPNALSTGATIFLRSHTGHHVDIQGESVQSRWVDQGGWQALVVETHAGKTIFSGDVIFLRSHTGNHIDIEDEVVRARWQDQGSWQALTIEKAWPRGPIFPEDMVFLRSHTGKHLDVQGDADGVVRCRWSDHGMWQGFMIELKGTSTSSTKAFLFRTTTTTTMGLSTFVSTMAETTTTMGVTTTKTMGEPTTTTTMTTTMPFPTCDASTATSIVSSMTTECQKVVESTSSYEEICPCYLQVPNSTASAVNCSLLSGDLKAFHQTYEKCKKDFGKEKEVWRVTKSDVCCRHHKIVEGSTFLPPWSPTSHSAESCGALALEDPNCDPNVLLFTSKDRCYCVPRGQTCHETFSSGCSGWNVWEPQTPRTPLPAPVPVVTPSGYTKIQTTYCRNDCVDVIAQYRPYQLNATECEQLCNANPRCKLYVMAHCGHQCILHTHCSGQKMSLLQCNASPGTALYFRPGWQPLTVTLGLPGDFVGGQGIWGKPASECGDNVYGDWAKGRCNLELARKVGRVSICESRANCVASNITSAQACAEKAALISFCAKDYIEWRTSNSSCYCAPVGHSYTFSTSAGGHSIYPMTIEEPK